MGVAIESPLFRKGQIPLSIVTHSVERLRVYDGGSPVSFPAAKKNKKKRKRVSGAKLYLTPNTNSTNFELRINLKALKIRTRENCLGAITVGFLKLPAASNNHIGLLGILDKDGTNDFTSANGIAL